MESSAAELCALERQMITLWPFSSHPHPRSAPFSINLFINDSPQPSGFVWLESTHGLQRYRISCVGTHIQARQGHQQNTSSWTPHPKPIWQHQTIMQLQLKSWKAAGSEQVWVWDSAIFVPKWCKMVPEWPMPHFPLTISTQPNCQ